MSQRTKADRDDLLNLVSAFVVSTISKGKRLKVGAILVTDQDVSIRGVNGLPKALGNDLENIEYKKVGTINSIINAYPYTDESGKDYRLITKSNVIHAELNCILKAAREGVSVLGSTVYVTDSPCQHCAAMLITAGVKRVVYCRDFRDAVGVADLKMSGVEVKQYTKAEVNDFYKEMCEDALATS